MTLAEFQATGRDVDDLGTILGDELLMGHPGRLYCNDCLYIERTGEDWSIPPGLWYTLIGRAEYWSANLEDVERPLYEFARSEGYTV